MTGCVTDLGAVTVKAAVTSKNDHVFVRAIGRMFEAKMESKKPVLHIPRFAAFQKSIPIIINICLSL